MNAKPEKIRTPRACKLAAAWMPFAAMVLFCRLDQLDAAEPVYTYQPSPQEAELYVIIRGHAAQERVQVVLDPRLCAAAHKQAEDTQRRKFFAHKNPDGVNSNQRVINEGYPLPSYYDPAQNYVESMAGSVADTPADAVQLWAGSPAHANHVFGKSAFYREQVVIGVGRAPATGLNYATYVFISAPGPVGQSWSVPWQEISKVNLRVDGTGLVLLRDAPAQAILEIWTSPELGTWTLRQTLVAEGGDLSLGQKQGEHGFFRLGYFRP